MKLDLPPPVKDKNHGFQVLGSSVNGTICLVPYVLDDCEVVVFWNPTTDEFKDISFDLPIVDGVDTTTISCDGFGYDPLRDDYILVRMVEYLPITKEEEEEEEELHLFEEEEEEEEEMQQQEEYTGPLFELYYPNGQCRRTISIHFPEFYEFISMESEIYLNGTCHWRWVLFSYPIDDYRTFRDDTYFDALFSVDVGNNKLTTTLIREYNHDEDFMDMQLVALLDRYVATISMSYTTKCIDISILGEVGVNESWVKLFTIGPLSSIENVMGIGIHGDILLRNNDDELVSFDLGTQEIQEIGIKGLGDSQTLIYEINFQPIGRITN